MQAQFYENTHFQSHSLQGPFAPRFNLIREMEVRGDLSPYDLAEAIVHDYGFDFGQAFGSFNRTGEDYLHPSAASKKASHG